MGSCLHSFYERKFYVKKQINNIFLFIFLLISTSSASAICRVDFEPDSISASRCTGVSASTTAANLETLQQTMNRIYHSNDVQTDAESCRQFTVLMKSVCRPLVPVTASFISADRSLKNTFTSKAANDVRLVLPPSGATINPTVPYPAYVGTSCKEGGKTAITLTPTCGEIQQCEASQFVGDVCRTPGGDAQVLCTTVNGVFQCNCYNSSNQIIPFSTEMVYSKTIKSSRFFGTCTDSSSRLAQADDLAYVASYSNPQSAQNSSPIPCNGSSTSCLLMNVPLLQQDGFDLKKLLAQKTRITNPKDVGFCGPTTLAMMLAGLRNQTQGTMGDVLDSGASYADPLDGSAANNWSASVFRSGQMLGTDWWVGGSSLLQSRSIMQNNLGSSAGTIDDLMGTVNGYTNQNFINFTNQQAGIVQMPLSMDTTGNGADLQFHSLLVAGHAGGHLRVMDPWGRMYLVDMQINPRNAIFYQINEAMMSYGDAEKKVFTVTNSQYVATYTFTSTPTVGKLYPAWWWSSDNAKLAISMFEAVGAVTKVTKTGSPVPQVTHLSGDQGYVYFSPQNTAQMLPRSEVAARSPYRGAYFDAADSQNVQDMLFGSGQRIRGSWASHVNRPPTDAEYHEAFENIIEDEGWLGSADAQYSSTVTNNTIQNCPTNATAIVQGVGLNCTCTSAATSTGNVYGTGVYTADSKICRAALHAGVITSSGGDVIVTVAGTQSSFTGSVSNGVTSQGSTTPASAFNIVGVSPLPAAPSSTNSNSLLGLKYNSPVTYMVNQQIRSNVPSITSGVTASLSFSVSPALPAGLSLNTTTGAIGGTPTAYTPAAVYTITASSGGTVSKTATVNIGVMPTCLISQSVCTLQPAYVGSFGDGQLNPGATAAQCQQRAADYHAWCGNSTNVTTATFYVNGEKQQTSLSYLYSAWLIKGQAITPMTPVTAGGTGSQFTIAPALPAGLAMDRSTGIISGIPADVGAAVTYTVKSANAAGTVTTTLTFGTILPADPVTMGTVSVAAAQSGFPGTNLVDQTPDTSFKSPAVANPTTTVSASAWTAAGNISATQVVMTAKMVNGKARGFPAQYGIYVAASNGASWILLGVYAIQPDAAGKVIIPVSNLVTSALTVTATTLGSDLNSGYNFELVDVKFGQAPASPPTSLVYSTVPTPLYRGTSYSFSPTVQGGVPSSYSITPTLPPGLSLSTTTGIISGTPAIEAALKTYQITATNAKGSAIGSLMFSVVLSPPVITYPTPPAYYQKGTAMTALTPTSTGGPVTTYSISPTTLPAGMSFNTSTGVISGTPTAVFAPANFVVTATNSGGSVTKTLPISVQTGLAGNIDGFVQTATGVLLTGWTCILESTTATSVDLYLGSATGTLVGRYTTDQYTESAVDTICKTTGILRRFRIPLSSSLPLNSIVYLKSVYPDAGNPLVPNSGNLAIPAPTGGIQSYNFSPAIPTTLDHHKFYSFVKVIGMNGSDNAGLPTVFTVTPALPAGMTLSNGDVSGAPSNIGASATYTFKAANSVGYVTKAVTFNVAMAAPRNFTYPNFTLTKNTAMTATSPTYAIVPTSVAYTEPTSFSISPALPAGVSLNTTTGVISGTPTATMTSTTFTVTGTNAVGSKTAQFTLTVNL